ncbi:hypothetical protein [Nostoc sp. FACHB-133]|uniref:hypothetical protein n=1 Tax=Nostoc sp. FACHB-133 TaxID=2692835 RepID=UPI001688855C|nr:hypothetical protein [Nostoc sp. FACHB-133]MBD2527498.1 hypothetical protein [Nostoc sp. FACHB-133]
MFYFDILGSRQDERCLRRASPSVSTVLDYQNPLPSFILLKAILMRSLSFSKAIALISHAS